MVWHRQRQAVRNGLWRRRVAPGTTLGVDEEASKIWLEQQVPEERVVAVPGLKDNFWAMGDTGPCGPCSEIFYDMGLAASEEGHADCQFPCDCGRYVEIWNLVFMQFNRDATGTLTPLPKPSIDTGMGLERVAAVLQSVISNYDTDLFLPIMKRAAELCGVDFNREEKLEEGKGGAASLRVIADHARATTFLITDGVVPSNEGRGYVLRKIVRRAIHHGRLLGKSDPFLYETVDAVVELMGKLIRNSQRVRIVVKKVVLAEEKQFARTISAGLPELELDIDRFQSGQEALRKDLNAESFKEATPRAAAILEGQASPPAQNPVVYPGANAYRIYETYGLRRDFIATVVRDRGMSFDEEGFDRALEEQRTRARCVVEGRSWQRGGESGVREDCRDI